LKVDPHYSFISNRYEYAYLWHPEILRLQREIFERTGTEHGRDKRADKKIGGDSSKDKGRNPLGTDRPHTDARDSRSQKLGHETVKDI
jgi:hypothetical protein